MKKTYFSLFTVVLLNCVAQAQTTVSNNLLRFPNGGNTITYMKEDWGINLFGNSVRPIKIANTSLMVGYTSNNQNLGIGNALISGRVGIGTTTPSVQLSLLGSGFGSGNISAQNTDPDNYSGMNLFDENGQLAASVQYGNSQVNELSNSFFIGNRGAGATHIISGEYAQILMTVLSEGNVGIGNTNPQNKLDVNGTIHSRQVNVDANGWPDYVFKPSYFLPSLKEVKTYIDKNHHLPEVPSEKEVNQNGVNLGEMNKVLIKKVEELTLYLVQMNTEVKSLKKKVKKLENKRQLNEK